MRPGDLSTAAAIAVPAVSTPGSVVPNITYLVDEDRLPKVLDKVDNSSRVLRFIEDPSHLSFLR